MEKRFDVKKEQAGFGTEIFIIKDNQTGVQYLHFRNAASGGLTPLIDTQGKPLLEGVSN